jgi:hypothetical protein
MGHSVGVKRLAALASALAATIAPAPVTAAGGWRSAQELARGEVGAPLVAVAPNGLAVAAWSGATGYEAATGRVGHRWERPVTVTRSVRGPNRDRVQLAVAPTGAAALIWQVSLNGVWVAFRPAAGAWERPRLLADHAYWPQVGFDAAGNATATWWRLGRIQAVERAVGGVWGEARDVAVPFCGAACESNPRLAVGASGRALLVWKDEVAGFSFVVSALRQASGAAFGPFRPLATGRGFEVSDGRAAFDPAGRAIATWRRSPATRPTFERALAAADGSWSAVEAEAPPFTAFPAHTVPFLPPPVDLAGDRFAAWWTSDGRVHAIQAARRPAGAPAWEPAETLQSTPGDASAPPALAVSERGDAIVVWQRREGARAVTQAAFRAPSAPAWERPAIVAPSLRPGSAPGAPALGMDRRGDAIAVWAECAPAPGSAGAGRCVIRAALRPQSR